VACAEAIVEHARAARVAHAADDFVARDSVVRRIWRDADMILLIFAGSAAEFALNRAVDWLFFTGKLPKDPIGRFFSTAAYAQQIVFADAAAAEKTLARIRAAHEDVEMRRGQRIPDWAHRDVLYMLIDYSQRAHEILSGRLSILEQRELYAAFARVGRGLGIAELPVTYEDWQGDRTRHLERDLVVSNGTTALYAAYRRHLGVLRYSLLLAVQSILTPDHVRGLLKMPRRAWLRRLVKVYPLLIRVGLRRLIQRLLIPSRYLQAVRSLDRH
jgi:uncharacterized protein (DUF2236 family)